MYAASFFKRVVNIPHSLCLVVGGVMSGALYLGGIMMVNPGTLRRLSLMMVLSLLQGFRISKIQNSNTQPVRVDLASSL